MRDSYLGAPRRWPGRGAFGLSLVLISDCMSPLWPESTGPGLRVSRRVFRGAVRLSLSGSRLAPPPAVPGLLAASPSAAALCRRCPQVPANLHAPASCSARRPCGGRGSGTPWSIRGTAGCCPRRGPGQRRRTCRQPGRRGGLSRPCGISAAAASPDRRLQVSPRHPSPVRAAEGAGLPLAEGRCSPGHGPAADAHALRAARMARMAWSSPAPVTGSLAA